MKIAEILGSYADREEPDMGPDSSLLQTIANAFTRSGKVKRPLNKQPSDGQPLAGQIPISSFAASDEDPAADAVSNTSTDPPIIPHDTILGPRRVLASRVVLSPHRVDSRRRQARTFV
jgi:hypothetical protein